MRALLYLLLLSGVAWAKPVDLSGRARDFHFTRNWNAYYWREDFRFVLEPDGGGPPIQVISREPTPAYHWRLGTTYPKGVEVNWESKPRVRVVGVTGLDRDPAEFYGQKLDLQHLVTAQVVWVGSRPYYVNNWFHSWGKAADAATARIYSNQPAPFDIYGFVKGAPLPFNPAGQALLQKHPAAKFYHGLIRGGSIEVLHLIEQDQQGEGHIVVGSPDQIPLLDERKP